MNQRLCSEDIKRKALELGADLAGIASIDRFAGAPAGFHPADLMPGAQSVIVVARRLPLSVLMNRRRLTTYINVNSMLWKELDRITAALSCCLEDRGAQAYPVPADNPYTNWDEEEQCGRGDLSHRHAAAAAGLGFISRSSMLVTSRFGNRVNLASLITNLQLEPDPLPIGSACPEDCFLCEKAYPAGAIHDKQVVQKSCRQQVGFTLDHGFEVYRCLECRRVCPLGRQ